jgi:hypothetical protein
MTDPNFDGYYIIWLDQNGKEIGDEWIFKPTYEDALQSAGLRIYQSPHKCPVDVGGFYIEHVHRWRERHGHSKNKLGEMLG